MSTVENIKQKASFLNNLSNNEDALFEYINTNHDNLDEVIHQYKPEREFRPVNTLRFLIANELKKGTLINSALIEQLKLAIESRDVSNYYNLNDAVKQSLANYKDSKVGMFPNWRHAFKILFPFIHNASENEEVKTQLNQLAQDIIEVNQLENVTKHIVSFQGSQNYGSDRVWVAIIPNSASSVQYAYQIFFNIDKNGLVGGVHKGHNLVKQTFNNQDDPFETWDSYLSRTKTLKEEWKTLNSNIDFLIINDEKSFQKTIKKIEANALNTYFDTLDDLVEELEIQDEEKLVFSVSNSQLSFQVGKRYCLNVKKNLFDFIAYNEIVGSSLDKETFSEPNLAYLYRRSEAAYVLEHFEDIKNAVDIEIGRDNHTSAKTYDNSAFRKAVFDKEYRDKILKQIGMQTKYYLVGAYWDNHNPKDQTNRFVEEGIWVNGYDDKFIKNVNAVAVGSIIAIKSAFTREKTKSVMAIKAIGIVKENLNDGRNLKVEWDKSFKPLEVEFGGYLTTIKEVKKTEHIKAIWLNNYNMEGKFKEFLGRSLAEGTVTTYLSAIRSIEKLANKEGIVVDSIYDIDNQYNFQTFWDKLKNLDIYISTNNRQHNRFSAALLKYQEFLNYLGKEPLEPKLVESKRVYKAPINQIFYGPPGTGKTYSTILESAKIINQDSELSYNEAQLVFNENLGNSIEFITFHQNYSYEDFIQGLRPDIEQTALSFNRTDGVFTKMVTNALFEYYKVFQKRKKQTKSTKEVKIDLNDAYIEFVGSLKKDQEFETKTGMKIKVDNFTDRQNIEFKPLNGIQSYLVSGNRLLKLYEAFSDINDIKRVHEDIRDAIGGCNSSIYYVALREFISFLKIYEDTLNEFVDVEEDYDYDNITYRRKKELLSNISLAELRTVSTNEVPKYVIIIDEINRANISRVFGELITLIEKDKRSNGKIPITATLPSGEKFTVPSNLYIIGTMNTADKSIALLDIALRRRFEFVPMYPKYQLDNDNLKIENADILEKINDEIISRKGHDFTIGHSYFMGEDYEFKNTIDNKVVPLLLEYFMNDYDEVKRILKVAKLEVEGWPMKLKI